MSESIVDRYERILRADPTSRVFVELARALLERGEPGRAADTCARGVQHHPDSVIARIVWGKALLALGRTDEALARFDEAVAVDTNSSYAYDLAGEALVLAGVAEHATAFLERGAQQHPHDPRIQLWLSRVGQPAGSSPPVSGAILSPASPADGPPPLPNELLARMVPAAPPLPAPPPSSALEAANTPTQDEGAEGDPFADRGDASPGTPTEGGIEAVDGGDRVLALIPDEAPATELGASRDPVESEPPPDHPAQAPAPPTTQASFARRHLRLLALLAVVLAGSVGLATFLVVRNRQGAESARVAAEAARVGLARDTLGSLRQAGRVVDEARRFAARDPELAALSVEISALLAHDFGDGDARGAARAALGSTDAGRGAHAARWLVATDAEREDAARSLLSNRDATPLASTIAGQLLLGRGDGEAARAALDRAARERPPMLRAIALQGDLSFAAGDMAAAQERFQAVLRVQSTHPHAALGLADVSLASGVDLAGALNTLEAVAADRDSTVPLHDRLRFDLTLARLLAANGRAGEALPIVEQASARHPGRADVTATVAQVLASAGELDRALATARKALEQSRGEPRYRELVAHVQLRRGRFRDLLATSEKDPTRTVRTYRGIARLALGDVAGARTELEATRRDGKMTPEAAGWAALVEIAAGRNGPVTGVVDALLELPMPPPSALLARGRLDLSGGRRGSAEHHLRDAMARDPDLIEARVALGDLLVETNRVEEAVTLLNGTVARAPWRGIGRVALARALLASGRRQQAVGELAAVLASSPDDPPAEASARQLLRSIRRAGRPSAANSEPTDAR